jgi:low temperature requirement protein LtrA
VWWIWVSFTVFSNVSWIESPAYRLAVLANMACLVVMAAGVGQALHGHPALFAAGYAASRLCRLLPWLVAQRAYGGRPAFSSYVPFVGSALLWAASIVVPVPWGFVLWGVALVLELVPGLGLVPASGRRLVVLEPTHLVERFGLFAIIALGEGVAQIVAGMAHDAITADVVVTGVAAFVLLAVLWWLYFDFGSAAAELALRARPEQAYRIALQGFVLGHFLIVAGIMTIAAGLGQLIAGPDHALGLRLVCAGLALYLTNNAVLGLRLIGVSARRVATWYLPTLATLIAAWFLSRHLAPAVALFGIAAVMTVTSALGLRLRRPTVEARSLLTPG